MQQWLFSIVFRDDINEIGYFYFPAKKMRNTQVHCFIPFRPIKLFYCVTKRIWLSMRFVQTYTIQKQNGFWNRGPKCVYKAFWLKIMCISWKDLFSAHYYNVLWIGDWGNTICDDEFGGSGVWWSDFVVTLDHIII